MAQGAFAFGAVPVQKPQSGTAFYNYFSASGHTGFESLNGSVAFFYRNSQNSVLSLILEHGIDFDTSMQSQPASEVIMDLTGLPTSFFIALADDQNEVLKQGATGVHADWKFQNNADGAVLSGFPLPGNWSVTIIPKFVQGITTWSWVRPDGSLAPLDLNTPIVLTAFDSPSMCRTDCTVPKCGDGIIDGGEVCDDGNNVSGDGCAADCKSLQ